MELMSGTQARAQQYFFFAERKANKIEGLPDGTEPRPVHKVGVIGAGTMGGGISMNFLSAGIPVTIVEMGQDALDRGAGLMRKNYEASAAKGKLSAEQAGKAMGLLTPTLDFQALADCDLIIEAVYENMDVKKEVFGRLDRIAKPGAILASNTSYLNIDEIAASISRPGDVVGLHFFSPANIMKLLEVVRGRETAPDVVLTAMATAKRIRKVAVVAGVCHGFIGNRMLMPRQIEATKLLLEGASPEQIDRVHVDFGMPMGPFQMADLAGVDIGWHRDPNRIENIRDALCALDRWGQKKGAGFYDYDDKRRPSPSPVVAQIIEDFARKQSVERREISDEEIVERTLYTMVNEGAKILEEGIAQRASDIDVVWVYGYGWPVYRGGPMFWADTIGLAHDRRGPQAPGSADEARVQLLAAPPRQSRERRKLHALNYPPCREAMGRGTARRVVEGPLRQSSGLSPPHELRSQGGSIVREQTQHRQRDGGDGSASDESRARPVAVPQHARAEAGNERGDSGHEPESAEAGRAQLLGRAVGDHPREDALRQRHVRAPQADADHQPGVTVCDRKDEIAGDQHRDAGHQDRPRAHAVAKGPGGIGKRDISEIEDRQRQRRPGFAKADVEALQDQERFGKAGEREQETDHEQALRLPVELPEAGEEGRLLVRRQMLRGLAQRQPREQERQSGGDHRDPKHRADIAREPPHQRDRGERREQRADGVERLPEAEGAAADLRRGLVGDHGVAGRAADALADAVGEARGHHRRPAGGEREERLGQSGEAVTGEDPRLALEVSVGQPAGKSLAKLAVASATPSIAPSTVTGKPSTIVTNAGSSA